MKWTPSRPHRHIRTIIPCHWHRPYFQFYRRLFLYSSSIHVHKISLFDTDTQILILDIHLLVLSSIGQPLSYSLVKYPLRWAINAGDCWRNKYKLVSDFLEWTTTQGHTRIGRAAKTYNYQLCENTEYRQEYLHCAMTDRRLRWENPCCLLDTTRQLQGSKCCDMTGPAEFLFSLLCDHVLHSAQLWITSLWMCYHNIPSMDFSSTFWKDPRIIYIYLYIYILKPKAPGKHMSPS